MAPRNPNPSRSPVITGYGAVTTHGSGLDRAWAALVALEPAGRATSLGPEQGERFAACLSDDYRPHSGIPRNLVHVLDAGSLIAIDAALQALESAGVDAGSGDARRFAVADGLAFRAPGQTALFAGYGQAIARVLGVRGPVIELGGADAAGLGAIAAAAGLVASGEADIVLAGAAQALQPQIVEHLDAQGWLAGRPARPFDQSHNGLVPSEGSAYVVIEAEELAGARGARIRARVAGASQVFDPSVEPLEISAAPEAGRAIQAALADAGYLQNQVDLVISCADGRPKVDFADGYGIKRTFGRHSHYASVTTAAASLGHALAASGPLGLVLGLEAMERQQAFPIAGFDRPEHDLDLSYVRVAETQRIHCVLVTSLGLGGTNVSLLLQR